MAYPDDPGALLLSLQDRGLGEAPAAHLALGALIGSERVVFDLPTGLEIRDDADLEVLIAPTEPAREDLIERIRPLQVLIRSAERSPDDRVALVLLGQHARYGIEDPRFTQDQLLEALERTGGIWSALVDLRVVSGPLRDLDRTDALTRIAKIETYQRTRLVSQLLARRPGDLASCPFSNITQCQRGGFLRDRP